MCVMGQHFWGFSVFLCDPEEIQEIQNRGKISAGFFLADLVVALCDPTLILSPFYNRNNCTSRVIAPTNLAITN
jgi:hypothetical protein